MKANKLAIRTRRPKTGFFVCVLIVRRVVVVGWILG